MGGRDLLIVIDLPMQTRHIFPYHHPPFVRLGVHLIGHILFCCCHNPENIFLPSLPLIFGCHHIQREIIKSVQDMLNSYSSYNIELGGLCLQRAFLILPSPGFVEAALGPPPQAVLNSHAGPLCYSNCLWVLCIGVLCFYVWNQVGA